MKKLEVTIKVYVIRDGEIAERSIFVKGDEIQMSRMLPSTSAYHLFRQAMEELDQQKSPSIENGLMALQ
jgi:hypothetical protein